MPGLITHYICGETVFNAIDASSGLKALILENRSLYNIGTQGPDIFFYNLKNLLKKKTKDLGSKMHRQHFAVFIKEIASAIDAIDDKKTKAAAASYICGFLTHYSLDGNVHPYIYCKTGYKETPVPVVNIRYSVRHRSFETTLDVALLKLAKGEKPSDHKLWQLIKVSKKEALLVSEILGKSILSAYDVDLNSKDVYRSMFYMMYFTKLIQSKNGKRKKFIELAEGVTIGEKLCSSFIHEQTAGTDDDYLNIAKTPWKTPYGNAPEFTHSFMEMFEKACNDAICMQTAFLAFLQKKITMDILLDITGDFSFKGMDSSRNIMLNRPIDKNIVFSKATS